MRSAGAGFLVLGGMSRASVLLLFVAFYFRPPALLWAQAEARPDSFELNKQARNAQDSFERLRRRRMRFTRRYVGGSCDERIGREPLFATRAVRVMRPSR